MERHLDYLWQRLWLPQKSKGLLNGSEGGEDQDQSSGVPLADLAAVPCLILLGAPGLGKSNEVRLAAHEALTRGEAADVIPLGRLTGADELERRLLSLAKAQSTQDKIWNIFLDGLDEALPHFTKSGDAIAATLRALSEIRQLKTIRFRICSSYAAVHIATLSMPIRRVISR